MTRTRIAIVGAGLAGLSTAEALLREHPDRFDITLFEAKRVPGGRAGSFDDPQSNAPSGRAIDYCQHVAMGCCTNLISLMDRSGLASQWKRYPALNFLHPEFPPSRFAPSKWLPAPLHLATTVSALKYLTWREQRSVRRALVRLMRTPTTKLGDKTARQWLGEMRQAPSVIRLFWDVILVSALGEQTDSVSMSAARKVIIDGFAAAKGAADVLVPTQPLRKIIGESLRQKVQELGAKVQTSHRIETIGENPVHVQSNDQCWAMDHIVSAVPWHQAGRLLDAGPVRNAVANLDQIAAIPSSPITGLHLWFDRPITSLPHAVLVGTTSQWLFRDPIQEVGSDVAINKSHKEHYYQVVISASHEERHIGKDELVDQVVFELRRLFPATSNAKLIRSQIVTDPNSVFSVRPSVEAIRPPAHTALPWLHLAGDWIATTWPATMEGAVISGRMAANSVCKSLRIPQTTIDAGLPRGWLARKLIAD